MTEIKQWTELTKAREKAGLTRKQLADKLDTSESIVEFWETNPDVQVTVEGIQGIAKALNVTVEELDVKNRAFDMGRLASIVANARSVKKDYGIIGVVKAYKANGGLIREIHVTKSKGVTAVKFYDGSTFVSKCAKGDKFDLKVGVALAVAKHAFGSGNKFSRSVYNTKNIVNHDEDDEDEQPEKSEPQKDFRTAAFDEKFITLHDDETGYFIKFANVGVPGVYLAERALFKAPFTDYASCLVNLKLWFYKNAPKFILDEFDIDLPSFSELFDEAIVERFVLDGAKPEGSMFPSIKNKSDRIRTFNGDKTIWFTKTMSKDDLVFSVNENGEYVVVTNYTPFGIVPVLRSKKSNQAKKAEGAKK